MECTSSMFLNNIQSSLSQKKMLFLSYSKLESPPAWFSFNKLGIFEIELVCLTPTEGNRYPLSQNDGIFLSSAVSKKFQTPILYLGALWLRMRMRSDSKPLNYLYRARMRRLCGNDIALWIYFHFRQYWTVLPFFFF